MSIATDVLDVVMFDDWTEVELEELAEQCGLPEIPQTTRQSCWSDDYTVTDLIEGAGLPNEVKVTRLSGRML